MRRRITIEFEPTVPNGAPLALQPKTLYSICGPWPFLPSDVLQNPIELDPENPQVCWCNVPITITGGRIAVPNLDDLQALNISLALVSPI